MMYKFKVFYVVPECSFLSDLALENIFVDFVM